jgi:hypothetical protein
MLKICKFMIQTVEVVIDQDGQAHLAEEIRLPASRLILVTRLEKQPITLGGAENGLVQMQVVV